MRSKFFALLFFTALSHSAVAQTAAQTTLQAAGVSQTVYTVAAGGAVVHGCIIANPSSAATQGISSAESIFINLSGAAAANSAASNSVEVVPGASLTCPFSVSSSVTWNAATVGHKIYAFFW